jgi:hypothetical protein
VPIQYITKGNPRIMNEPVEPIAPWHGGMHPHLPIYKTSPGTRARCVWEVTAGVLPGHGEPEHTRRWCLTSETWEAESEMSEADFKAAHPDGKSTFLQFRDEAFEYAARLHDPSYLNWVRVDWLWM